LHGIQLKVIGQGSLYVLREYTLRHALISATARLPLMVAAGD